MKHTFVLGSLALLASCHHATPKVAEPVSAAKLSDQYAESKASVRSQYDGKEIFVRGYAPRGASLPGAEGDQGSVLMDEKGRQPSRPVTCWFSQQQASEFAKIKGGEYLIVKGVFSGEEGAELRFCKLLKVE